jgi:hypothetical protein
MTSRLLISLSLLLIAAQRMSAQLAPAEDFFNGGAQFYVSNNVPAALERVELGLKTYPDDVKLKKLEELLKQKQQQNQQQQNQQQQNQQNQSQQQKSDSQKEQQQKQNSQNQQKQDEQQKSSAQKSEGKKPDKQDAQAQPAKPGEMTKEEAKHLLDAQKGNEQILQMKPQAKPRNPDQPVRDW